MNAGNLFLIQEINKNSSSMSVVLISIRLDSNNLNYFSSVTPAYFWLDDVELLPTPDNRGSTKSTDL